MALVEAVVLRPALQRAQADPALDLVQIAPQVVQALPTAVVAVAEVVVLLQVVPEVRVLLWWPIQNHRNSQVVLLATWVAQWYTHLPQQVI
jgi:hypothetical protein